MKGTPQTGVVTLIVDRITQGGYKKYQCLSPISVNERRFSVGCEKGIGVFSCESGLGTTALDKYSGPWISGNG